MSAAPGRAPARSPWLELDWLRGFAVAIMVFNHAVAIWYGREPAWTPAAELFLFVGGFAPVLFFFATGFGSGLQSLRRGRGGHAYGLGRKLGVLFIADQFTLWRFGVDPPIGLDFLGFVALSTAVLEPLRGMRRAAGVAALLALAVLLLRFVVSPLLLPDPLADPQWRWLAIATGRVAVRGLSYPPLPWLAYPLLGFVLGRLAAPRRAWIERHAAVGVALLGGAAVLCGALSAALHAAGWPVTRYGILSLGYFPAGLSAIAGVGALALAVCRGRGAVLRGVRQAIPLRGVASLAVVPLHFAVLHALGDLARPPMQALPLAASIAAVAAVSMAAARRFAAALGRLAARGDAAPARAWWAFALGALAIGVAVTGPFALPPLPRRLLCALAQLLLCGLLVLEPPRARAAR